MVPDDLDFTKGPRKPAGAGVVAAGIIIAVGVLFLLDQNNIINAWSVVRFWPLLLIGLGLYKLAEGSHGARTGAVILIVIGVLNSGWAIGHVNWSRFWPVVVIAVGLLLLWQAMQRQRGEPDFGSESARLNEWAVFGGGERRITTQAFDGGEVVALFGGFDIDLRKSLMKGDRAVIELNCFCGGATIRIPEDWNATIRVTAIFGGYSDTSRHPRPDEFGTAAKQLIVTGICFMGGFEVKN